MGVMNEDRLTLYDGLIKTHITNTTVAKETGKGLSTNDYTTTEKNKLAGIATGANKTTVDSAMSSTSTNPVQNKIVNSALSTKAPLASPTLTGTPKAPTAAKGTNTTQIATTAYVQREVADLKKSVSDGKTLVAAAITEKGVETAADASFSVIAENIGLIDGGSSGIALNVFTQENEPETKEGVWVQTANPYQSVVVGEKVYYNNPIEVIKWTDTSPILGAALIQPVVYNNLIYIFSTNRLYTYNGVTKEQLTVSVPSGNYYPDYSSSVVYNNKIYLMGSGGVSNANNYYTFDGSLWSDAQTLPYPLIHGSAVVYNNEIHIMGASYTDYMTKHYAFNGTSWREVSTLPYDYMFGSAVVYNDEIHLLGGMNSTTKHYAFNGTSWREVSTLPYDFHAMYNAVVYNNEIHLIGNGYDGLDGRFQRDLYKKHYAFNGTSWREVSTLPYDYINVLSIVYNNNIYLISTSAYDYDSNYDGYHSSVSSIVLQDTSTSLGNKIAIYQNPSNTSGSYATNFFSGISISGENNKFPSGFDDIFYIDESGNVETAPTYYGDGSQWVKLKN